MVYISMDKKFVDRNLKNWNAEAIEEFGEEDGKETYLFTDDTYGKIIEFYEDEGEIIVDVENSKIGFISVKVKLDIDDYINLIQLAVKRLNKFKNILESLK
ncbi:MAG: hypothetical protein ACTSVW_00470 [Candidatus Njordarchaeales archaeon]